MLIQKFFAPANEVADVGLKEINMSRLGRLVALAGKNGSGKSRLLNKLEWYIGARLNGMPHVAQRRSQINIVRQAIKGSPASSDVPRWEAQIAAEQQQLDLTIGRAISGDEGVSFKAVRFVPKQLNLTDPRSHGSRELVSRFGQAKSPGLNGYEQHCLYYIQHLQQRWWNAGHQLFAGAAEEKEMAQDEYEGFQQLITQLLGCALDRNLDGEATLFGKPIPDAGLSDGQKVILQLCVALHAQRGQLANSVFLLDEPENHLHPAAAIDLLKALYEAAGNSQIWIATHSIPLLAYVAGLESTSIWYIEDGEIANAGRRPEMVLESLLGGEDRLGQLHAFTGLPAELAALNFAAESLLPPKVLSNGQGDPQVSQVRRIVSALHGDGPLALLDFGAGKGRLLQGLGAEVARAGDQLASVMDYFAFDCSVESRDSCERVIVDQYPQGNRRHFNSREDFFSHKQDGSIDVVVMCNVLHEVSPRDWLELFSPQSLIVRALKDTGYLLLVEDQRIPVGEKAHEHGFLVLDTSHLRTLFSVTDGDVSADRFRVDDQRNDGRLKAHLIAKTLLPRITTDSRRQALEQLQQTAKDQIRQLRTDQPTYANGLANGYWTQQFANASLILGEI